MLVQFINGLNSSDEIFLITFSTKPDLFQPLTTDRQAVVHSLSKLKPFGQTSIYDAIVLAMGESRKGHYASKVILLITDGVDNSSTVQKQDAVAALRATGIRIYAIGIGDPNISKHRLGIALGPYTRRYYGSG
jgi:Ca-activated chloride channel homolog